MSDTNLDGQNASHGRRHADEHQKRAQHTRFVRLTAEVTGATAKQDEGGQEQGGERGGTGRHTLAQIECLRRRGCAQTR